MHYNWYLKKHFKGNDAINSVATGSYVNWKESHYLYSYREKLSNSDVSISRLLDYTEWMGELHTLETGVCTGTVCVSCAVSQHALTMK